jgi:hypothetical protein
VIPVERTGRPAKPARGTRRTVAQAGAAWLAEETAIMTKTDLLLREALGYFAKARKEANEHPAQAAVFESLLEGLMNLTRAVVRLQGEVQNPREERRLM